MIHKKLRSRPGPGEHNMNNNKDQSSNECRSHKSLFIVDWFLCPSPDECIQMEIAIHCTIDILWKSCSSSTKVIGWPRLILSWLELLPFPRMFYFPDLVWSAWGLVCLFFCPCHYFSDQSDKCRYCLARVLPPSPTRENDINLSTKNKYYRNFFADEFSMVQ